MTDSNNSNITEVARVAVRLPAFWPNRPAAWFAQAEAQFHLAGITNERTQFYHVISQLEERYVAEVDDIINSPPPRDPYTVLKTELIKRLCPSKDQRTRQLFEFEEMGDRRPSQFLRHLRSLAPDIPSDYLRILWSSRLPANIRPILAGLPDVELEAAALCADRILEAIPVPTVASLAPHPEYLELKRTVHELSRQVADLLGEQTRINSSLRQIHASLRQINISDHDRRPRSSSRRRGSPRESSTSRDDASRTLCWYHQRYGGQAQRCTKPCTFPQQEN